MKKLWNVLAAMSRSVLLAAAGILIISMLLGYRLGGLTGGLADAEVATYQSANSLTAITDNSVNAPFKSAVYLLTRIFDSPFGLRLANAVAGGLSIVLFYCFTRRLFSPFVAVALAAMFGTSSLFLHHARFANAEVMLLSILAILAAGYAVRFSRRSDIAWIVLSVVIGLSLYVPGMAIFIVVMAIWQFRNVRRSFEQLPTHSIAITSAVLSILAAPLVINLIREPVLWRSYLGLPAVMPPLNEIMRSMLEVPLGFFAISPAEPARWLGRQPVLDVLAIILFAIGLVAVARRFRLDRFWIITGMFVTGTVWIGLTGNHQNVILLLPFAYLLVGYGMDYLLGEWLAVFPRNPLAKTTGRVLLLAAILLSMNFQLHRYFVAWPNNDKTQAVFDTPASAVFKTP